MSFCLFSLYICLLLISFHFNFYFGSLLLAESGMQIKESPHNTSNCNDVAKFGIGPLWPQIYKLSELNNISSFFHNSEEESPCHRPSPFLFLTQDFSAYSLDSACSSHSECTSAFCRCLPHTPSSATHSFCSWWECVGEQPSGWWLTITITITITIIIFIIDHCNHDDHEYLQTRSVLLFTGNGEKSKE